MQKKLYGSWLFHLIHDGIVANKNEKIDVQENLPSKNCRYSVRDFKTNLPASKLRGNSL